MYRILIILSSIVLLAASCQKETSIDSPATLTYTVVPQVSFDVKSGTETINTEVNTEVNSISYLVYHKKINAQGQPYYEYIEEMGSYKTIEDPTQISVPITLIKDQEYKLVFIAQHRFESQQRTESYAYTYNSISKEMSVNTSAPFTNGDQLEAYVYVDEVGPITGNENRKITLNRIVSQINIGTNAATYPKNLNIAVTGAAASYNVFEGTYAAPSAESELDLYNIATPASGTDKIKVSNVDYNRLATLYCLGNNKLALTLTNAQDAADNFTISNVSTQVNYKTNIVGNILAGTYTVQVDNLEALKSAIANPKVTHIELTAPIYINSDTTIDGRGVTVTQAAEFENGVTSSNLRCIIKVVDKSTVTLKNIKFNNTFDYPLIETSYSVLHAENLTVTGHNSTSSMIILRGSGSFTNCTFTDNHCGGNGILHYGSGDDETKGLTIHGCTFSNNAVKSNLGDVATLNIGPRRNCVITDNIIQNNTVESTATTQTITGGLLICCPATITGNTITGNTPTDVYRNQIYGNIVLTNNTIGNIITTTNIN